MSVYVITVECELEAGFRCLMTMAMGRFSITSTYRRPYLGRYCCVNDENVSFSLCRDFATMVSNTIGNFPVTETPGNGDLPLGNAENQVLETVFGRAFDDNKVVVLGHDNDGIKLQNCKYFRRIWLFFRF